MFPLEIRKISCEIACADPEGGYGVRPLPPLTGKSQVIWVSIDITHWTPPLHGKSYTPLKPLKIIVFFEITIGHPL